MSPRERTPSFDSDQGAIRRYTVRDAAARDLSTATVEVYYEDLDGNSLGSVPGVIVGAKSDGKIDVMLRGRETDFGGAGSTIVEIPRVYYAESMAGAPAANLLANPSFDTDGNADGVADSWTLVGAKTATWAIGQTDPAPPAIFGKYQLVKHAGVADPDYIQQVLAPTLAAGDVLSVGCWHRSSGGAGEAASNTHALFFKLGAGANTYARFRVGDNDWYFLTGYVVADVAYSAATVGIDARGTTLSNRFDEAFAFVGEWSIFHGERRRIPVRSCGRPTKDTNQIAGVGGFEQDSNGDGLADGFINSAAGVTFSMERNPANVSEGFASQKVVFTDETANYIRLIWRGKCKNGDTWRLRLKEKTSGALSAGVGTGGLSLALSTAPFDGPAQSASTNLATNAAVFTEHTVNLPLTADRDQLYCDINLNGYTGTLWLDDLRLDRTVAAP